MPIIEVNGQELEFPDDMQPDAIREILRTKFPAPSQQVAQQGKPSFTQAATQPVRNIIPETSKAAQSGLDSLFAPLPQSSGKEDYNLLRNAGIGLGDVAKRTMGAVEYVSSPITGAVRALASQPSADLAVSQGMSPQNANNFIRTPIDLLGQFAVPAAMVKSAPAIGRGIDGAGRSLARGVEKLATPSRIAPNSEQLAAMGVSKFDEARASGEFFDAPSVSNKFISSIDTSKGKKIADTVETDLSQALESGLGKYRNLNNKPLGIDEVDIIDKDLSNLKDQAYNAGKNQLGSALSDIQNTLRGSVAESPSGQTLAEARDLFRRKYQMEDVERIFRNAEGRANEASIIQTGYRNLANQARKKGSGYTKDQIAIMDKAAKGGLSIDALKLASSRLIPVIAGASGGGFVGSGAAYMGNLAAGAGATALQTAKANKLAKSITKGITVEAEPTLINRAAAKLTKADLQKAFEAKKRIK